MTGFIKGAFGGGGAVPDWGSVTAEAGDVREGMKFFDQSGVLTEGTVPVSLAVDDIIPDGTRQLLLQPNTISKYQRAILAEPNFVDANIRAGVSIWGKSGKPSVVDTADGTAAANDIASGKMAYVNGAKVIGTNNSGVIMKYQRIAPAPADVNTYYFSNNLPLGTWNAEEEGFLPNCFSINGLNIIRQSLNGVYNIHAAYKRGNVSGGMASRNDSMWDFAWWNSSSVFNLALIYDTGTNELSLNATASGTTTYGIRWTVRNTNSAIPRTTWDLFLWYDPAFPPLV